MKPLTKTSLPILRCLSEGRKIANSRLPRSAVTSGTKRMLFEKMSTDGLTSAPIKVLDTGIALSPSTKGNEAANESSSSTLLSSRDQNFQVASDTVVRVKSSLFYGKGTCDEDDTGSFEMLEKIANTSCLDDVNVGKQEKSEEMTSLILSKDKSGAEIKSLSGERHK